MHTHTCTHTHTHTHTCAHTHRCVEWLKPGGKMFVHIFVHKHLAYNFETEGDDNWMGK